MTPVTSISIVVPTTGRRSLAKTLASVKRAAALASDLLVEAAEIVVVGDGPDADGVLEEVRSEVGPADATMVIVRSVERLSLGPAATRQRGLALAKGDIIFFCDDDDLFAPERISRALQIHTSTEADIVVVGTAFEDETGVQQRDVRVLTNPQVLLEHVTPHLGATSCRRDIAPSFDLAQTTSEDVAWWIDLLNSAGKTATVAASGETLYWMDRGEHGRTAADVPRRLAGALHLLVQRRAYFLSHPGALGFRLRRLGVMYGQAGRPVAGIGLKAVGYSLAIWHGGSRRLVGRSGR